MIVYSLHVLIVDLRLEFSRVCSRRGRPPPHPAGAGPRVANLGASCQGQHNEEINLVRERGAGANERLMGLRINQSEWCCCIFIFMNTDKDKKGITI